MKKLCIILAIITMVSTVVMTTGCGSSSNSGEKDLFDAKSWDYDGDGKLNDKEQKDYGDFYQDAYDYAYN